MKVKLMQAINFKVKLFDCYSLMADFFLYQAAGSKYSIAGIQ